MAPFPPFQYLESLRGDAEAAGGPLRTTSASVCIRIRGQALGRGRSLRACRSDGGERPPRAVGLLHVASAWTRAHARPLRDDLVRATGGKVAAMTTAAAPQGWYPDPQNQSQLRWWDGANWGNQTQPVGTPAASTGISPTCPGRYLGRCSPSRKWPGCVCSRDTQAPALWRQEGP